MHSFLSFLYEAHSKSQELRKIEKAKRLAALFDEALGLLEKQVAR